MIVKLKQWRFINLSTSASSSPGLQPSHPLLSTVHIAPPQSAALQLLSSAPQAWNLSDSVALVGILVFISSDQYFSHCSAQPATCQALCSALTYDPFSPFNYSCFSQLPISLSIASSYLWLLSYQPSYEKPCQQYECWLRHFTLISMEVKLTSLMMLSFLFSLYPTHPQIHCVINSFQEKSWNMRLMDVIVRVTQF